MKTQLTEVRTYIERWVCEECNSGTLEKDTINQSLDIREDGIYVPHICTSCGRKEFLKGDGYPKTVYKYL